MKWTYKDAGVDVTSGYKAVNLMKDSVIKTHNKNVIGGIGSFAGLYSLEDLNMKEPILVSGTDGVGTKLMLAFILDKHDSIGQDCVAMCVNDIICNGAKPLFFLDYLATGKIEPEKIAEIVKGISNACIESECALIGGETAEMPGFYKDDEYDLAGFVVGVVDKKSIIDGSKSAEGDVIIGLESSGVHSNGFSLIRKLVIEEKYRLDDYHDSLKMTVGESLLTPTRIYVKAILGAIEKINIKGIAHITGGGFIENIPRVLPSGIRAFINKGSWPISPIYKLLKEWGNMDEFDMFNTFNMGIGMALIVSSEDADKALNLFNELGYDAHVIGNLLAGERGVEFV